MCSVVCKLGSECGSSSPGRAIASQAVGSGFESRLPLNGNSVCRNLNLSIVCWECISSSVAALV